MTSLILWLIVVSHLVFAVTMFTRARFATRPAADEAAESIVSLLAAYTALLWCPVVLLHVLVGRFILDPLRLSIEWGADHGDSVTNPEKYGRGGRTMRRLIPGLPGISVGTYTRPVWVSDADRAGTVTNRLTEIGFRYFGLCIIRLGEPIADRPTATPQETS